MFFGVAPLHWNMNIYLPVGCQADNGWSFGSNGYQYNGRPSPDGVSCDSSYEKQGNLFSIVLDFENHTIQLIRNNVIMKSAKFNNLTDLPLHAVVTLTDKASVKLLNIQ